MTVEFSSAVTCGDSIEMGLNYTEWRKMVTELRDQWNQMWWERIDDKIRAEGIANQDFPTLFVEQGSVIVATRSYRPPNFEEIVEKNKTAKMQDLPQPPHPSQGGYRKFIRDVIAKQKRHGRDNPTKQELKPKPKKKQPIKKQGRGWLHATR